MVECTEDAAGRFELRDFTRGSRFQVPGSSRKKFHVYDRETKREVFHTDSWARADQVIRQAGSGEVTQHLKDFGHAYVGGGVTPETPFAKCGACKR